MCPRTERWRRDQPAAGLAGDGQRGGRLGYHSIVLAYRNETPIQALPPDGCGTSVDPPASPPNCAIDARMEILDGRGESTVVSVDRANSIENRLIKALQHLAATCPGEGWAQFLDGAEPKWSEIAVAGASLGAGEAVLIGMLHSVHRVAAFQGWTDAKHGWTALGMTPSSRYAALSHQRENLFARTCFAYVAFGVAPSCPLPAYTLVEDREPPFGTGQQRRDHDRVPPAPRPNPGAPHGRVQQAPVLHAVDHDPVTRSVSGKETA